MPGFLTAYWCSQPKGEKSRDDSSLEYAIKIVSFLKYMVEKKTSFFPTLCVSLNYRPVTRQCSHMWVQRNCGKIQVALKLHSPFDSEDI